MHGVIRKNFGGDFAVLARKARAFKSTFERCPFASADGSKLYFSLLATKPDKELLKEFLSSDFSPDQIQLVFQWVGVPISLFQWVGVPDFPPDFPDFRLFQ